MSKVISFKAKANKKAEILVYGDIGPKWLGYDVDAKSFHEELRALGDVDEIDLRINSFGGDVFDGLAIHRLLVDHKAKVNAHIDGAAMSIASVIAMAGDTIRISESGNIMIHDPWTVALGNAEDFRSVADRLDATAAAIADVYIKRTGNSEKQVRDWMRAETEFFGKAAVEHKFADEVAENLKIAARGPVPAFVTELRVADALPADRRPYRSLTDDFIKAAAAPETPRLDAMRDRTRLARQRLAMQKRASGGG